jgi:uncharacterized membrane protein (UPF0136 family)
VVVVTKTRNCLSLWEARFEAYSSFRTLSHHPAPISSLMATPTTDIAGFAFAAVVFLGGFMGYLKAGSVMSLLSGLTFGGALGYAANRASRNPQDVHLSFGLCVALFVLMATRFSSSGKFMPAGMVSLLRYTSLSVIDPHDAPDLSSEPWYSLVMVLRYGQRIFM